MSEHEKNENAENEDAGGINAEEFVDEALGGRSNRERSREELRKLFAKLFAMLFSDNKNESKIALGKINQVREKYGLSGNDVLELVGISSSSAKGDAKFSKIFEMLIKGRRNTADILIEIAEAGAVLFRGTDGRAYADIIGVPASGHPTPPLDGPRAMLSGHRETYLVRSRGFKGWLRYRHWHLEGHAPNPEAVETAICHLEASAQHDSKVVTRPIYTRIAAHEGKVYLDLADDDWRVIEVDADGWRLAKAIPGTIPT